MSHQPRRGVALLYLHGFSQGKRDSVAVETPFVEPKIRRIKEGFVKQRRMA
jgi:hypothetical protein